MTIINTEDWLHVLENTDYEPAENTTTVYQSYRFAELKTEEITVDNFREHLMPSLIEQVEMFIPPSGSFKTPDLRRYLDLIRGYETSTTDLMLGLSLADQIRLTFSDMRTSTICDRYPEINLSEKRRYRCVAEYLLRQEELIKVRDKEGKLVKKIGNAGKPVVLYRGLPKLHQTLKNSDLLKYIRHDRSKTETDKKITEAKSK